ncbi:MAG: hypothetical protein V4644_02975 [Patescibacteria group bacterium]
MSIHYKFLAISVTLAIIVASFLIGMTYGSTRIADERISSEIDHRSSPSQLTSEDAAKYLASAYIPEHSAEGLQFRLEKGNEINNWISFRVVPVNNDAADLAKIYLSNTDGTWTVRGFGTEPPYDESDYPEGI